MVQSGIPYMGLVWQGSSQSILLYERAIHWQPRVHRLRQPATAPAADGTGRLGPRRQDYLVGSDPDTEL